MSELAKNVGRFAVVSSRVAPEMALPRGRRQLAPRALTTPAITLEDYPPVYAAWVTTVKALGGVATVWPPNIPPAANAGKPAARFDAQRYGQLANAGKILPSASQTAKGAFAWVLAPAAVIAAAPGLSSITATEEEGLKQSLWERWGLPDLGTYGRYVAIGAGVVIVGGLAYKFWPRRRS